ncbi:transcriptional regulator TrmB [Amycolatopsis sp. 195334CR]|nr:transcriptional regulator TrmB [Amycolatopsis sp. 195334CR]
MLELAGLREVDVEVYRAVVDRGAATAAELAGVVGLSRQRLASVLLVLCREGLVLRDGSRPARFSAVAPEVGLGLLCHRREQELERARLLAVELQERHRLALGGQPGGLVEVVHGAAAVAGRADRMIQAAAGEVCFVDKPPYARSPSDLHPVERELLARGVRFRGVYDRTALELHDLRADLELGLSLGEEARVVTDAPLKLILVDDAMALVPLHSHAPSVEAALVVHPCALLGALRSLFEFLWCDAMPLGLPGSPQARTELLSTVDMRLLALLTTGMPDRGIAKQLGMSYRTFQRRLHELMGVLGARTRFQAGLQAAARGWVTVPVTQPRTEPRQPADGAASR